MAASHSNGEDPVFTNPLLGDSTDVPALDRIRPEHFMPALEAAFDRGRAALAQMIKPGTAPTIANIIIPLETCRRDIDDLSRLAGYFSQHFQVEGLGDVQAQMDDAISAFDKKLFQSRALGRKFAALKNSLPETADGEDRGILAYYDRIFKANGADENLTAAQRRELRSIDSQLPRLTASFLRNVTKGMEQQTVEIDDPAELAGIGDNLVAGFAVAAESPEAPRHWRIKPEPFLVEDDLLPPAESAVLRHRLVTARDAIGRVAPYLNEPLLAEIHPLKQNYARLMGASDYAAHARRHTANPDIGEIEKTIDALQAQLLPKFEARMRALEDFAGEKLTAENVGYWARRETEALFDFDKEAFARRYLNVERVMDRTTAQIKTRFGLDFTRAGKNAYGVHDDVRVYDVLDLRTGHRSVVLGDLYMREGKRAGAWMEPVYSGKDTGPTVICFALNAVPPAAGRDPYFSLSQYETVKHEMHHVVHGICGQQGRYASPRNIETGPSDRTETFSNIGQNLGFTRAELKALEDGRGGHPDDALIERLLAARRHVAIDDIMARLQAARLDIAYHKAGAWESADALRASIRLDSPYAHLAEAPPLERLRHPFIGPHSIYAVGVINYTFAKISADAVCARHAEIGENDPGLEKLFRAGVGGIQADFLNDYLPEGVSLAPFMQRFEPVPGPGG